MQKKASLLLDDRAALLTDHLGGDHRDAAQAVVDAVARAGVLVVLVVLERALLEVAA